MAKPKDNNYWVFGKHPVEMALKNGARAILRIISTQENLHLIKGKNINSRTASNNEITKEIGLPEAVHQGIAAYVSPIALESLSAIAAELEMKKKSLVVLLDQITDPQNIGSIIRSAAAFGADAVVLPRHNSPAESGTIAKASAGMIDAIPIVYASNLANAISYLKERNFWVIGLDGEAKEHISNVRNFDKIAFILGSEGKGMRRLTTDSCDLMVKINISDKVESLNVSNAAAIAFYEVSKQNSL